MTALYEQLPPHDVQAEESVIASLMVASDAIEAVLPILQASDFFREANQWTYAACKALHDRGEGIDRLTVAIELDKHGHLEDVGGNTWLGDIERDLPTATLAADYARIVKQDAIRRQMISAAHNVMRLGYDEATDVDTALRAAVRLMSDLGGEGSQSDLIHLSRLLAPYLDPAVDTVTGEVLSSEREGITTGLRDLDGLLGAVKPGALCIVGARTSMGKTALMLDITRHVARDGGRVAIFEAEMSGSEIAGRLLAAEASVDSKHLRPGQQGEDAEARIMRAQGEMAGWEVYVRDDAGRLDLQSIRSGLQRLQQDCDHRWREAKAAAERAGEPFNTPPPHIDLLVVDYLQIMDNLERSRTGNRVQEVSELSRGLKKIAREFAVPLLAGSQLSRKVDDRPDHHPLLADLRESGAIEQDADVVLFIYREEVYTTREAWESAHPDRLREPYPAGVAELIVAKHRNGPTGYVEARFVGAYSRFEDGL